MEPTGLEIAFKKVHFINIPHIILIGVLYIFFNFSDILKYFFKFKNPNSASSPEDTAILLKLVPHDFISKQANKHIFFFLKKKTTRITQDPLIPIWLFALSTVS